MKVAVIGSRGLTLDNLEDYLPKDTTEIVYFICLNPIPLIGYYFVSVIILYHIRSSMSIGLQKKADFLFQKSALIFVYCAQLIYSPLFSIYCSNAFLKTAAVDVPLFATVSLNLATKSLGNAAYILV